MMKDKINNYSIELRVYISACGKYTIREVSSFGELLYSDTLLNANYLFATDPIRQFEEFVQESRPPKRGVFFALNRGVSLLLVDYGRDNKNKIQICK